MFRRILFIGFLALPGSLLVVSIACVHPRSRAMLTELACAAPLLARVKGRIAVLRSS